MEYKDTLLMPKTRFEMRGKLPTKEPNFQKRWKESEIYEKMLENREGCEAFVLHDGPPYANGDIHLGHALNKILKDVIIRNRYMAGYKVPYVPGWDTHGLPIETAIQKLGHNRKEMELSDFRKLCYDYALEQVDRQKKGFLSLGVVGDYDHPYITLTKDFEAHQIEIFASMAMDGLIYKGLKPVYWSPSSETALAEAEIEYKDIKSPTIFVKFAVKDGKGVLDSDTSFVIWTTTPWTIPANLGICLNKDYTYALVESEKGKLIVLEELVDALWEKFGLETKKKLATYKGSELEMITCQHPLYDRESLVILGDHVTADAGTGCVHTAPGFGADDFFIGQKYGLPAYCNVDEHGCMMEDAGDWLKGQYVDDANKTVTQRLDAMGALLKLEFITHSYPHDWRTKKPIIFRATTQWFASIDKIREKLLTEIANVDWIPKWGQQRMHNMIADRGDWCISRQRAWGVPIPIFYAEDDTPIMDEAVFAHVAELFREHGSNIWFEKDAKELLPQGYTHPGSPNGEFRKETDTMDVWFDSGSTHSSVVDVRPEFAGHAADMYLEGSDQHRGWFMSSLMISTAMKGKAPYRQVLTHGFTVDGQGRKMSKSIGNTVSPQDVMNKLGADILRLWVASTDYTGEMAVSDEILKRAADSYRRIRNTARFLLANLNGFDPAKDMVKPEEMVVLDRWAVGCAKAAQEDILKAYEAYDFHEVVQRLMRFCSVEMGSFYLDIIKDRQYTAKADSVARRSCQTALYHIAEALVRWMAPILSFTADEVWGYLPGEREKYVFTGEWYEGLFGLADSEAMNDAFWDELLKVRGEVNKVIEQARADKKVGGSLEAAVTLYAEPELAAKLTALGDELRFVLLTSGATVADYNDAPADAQQSEVLKGLKVALSKAEGEKCPRCWHYTRDVGKVAEHAEICGRCVSNVAGDGEKRKFA